MASLRETQMEMGVESQDKLWAAATVLLVNRLPQITQV